MIKVTDFSFRYHGKNRSALEHISLTIPKGEMLVIAGPSGCGKSTLALALSGFLFQQDYGEYLGSLNYYDEDISKIPLFDMADNISLVQQNPEDQFCTLTVMDELAFGLENRCMEENEIVERIHWAMGVVQASDLLDRDLATLSGGEKQKIVIASMLAGRPEVLILDEPTSNLDPQSTANLFEVVNNLRQVSGLSIIIIEHKLKQLIPYSPRMIRMDQGKVIENTYLTPSTAEITPPIKQPIEGLQQSNLEEVVNLKGVTVSYDQRSVLQDINLSISTGEFISLMGANGSGKTTFLLCLTGLLPIEQGSITLLGMDIKDSSVQDNARSLGFVFQNPDHQLFTDSVWKEAILAPENFKIPSSQFETETMQLLKDFELKSHLDIHPNKLSFGEKRRLNLTSILSYRPKVILLDEILIGQDVANAVILLDILKQFSLNGGVVILANHQPELVNRYATRTIFLKNGQIALDRDQLQAETGLFEINEPYFLPYQTVESAQ